MVGLINNLSVGTTSGKTLNVNSQEQLSQGKRYKGWNEVHNNGI